MVSTQVFSNRFNCLFIFGLFYSSRPRPRNGEIAVFNETNTVAYTLRSFQG